jgi:hypothetical protein
LIPPRAAQFMASFTAVNGPRVGKFGFKYFSFAELGPR